ncbi:MAG: glycosyltransferase family 4 protein [Acidobacteriota bacterium]|nr:glycosyltransferase family 4 protein [Acidobacteriota bacterium]
MNEAEDQNHTKISHIIYAWPYLSWGGAQVYFLGLLKEARKHFEIRVLLPEGTDRQLLEFFREENVEIDFFEPAFVPPGGEGLNAKFRLHKIKILSERAMLNALRSKYDLANSIVHIELAPWQSLMSLVWLCIRCKVVITMHNSLPEVNPLRKLLWKIKLRAISRFENFTAFASNVDSKNYFRGLYSDQLHQRIAVTYTNVNPDEIAEAFEVSIDPSALRIKNGLRDDSFLVMCVGQFIDRKGRWTFLEAARQVSAERDDIDFAWVSNSPLSPEDAARVESYALGNRFNLIDSEEIGAVHTDLFKLVRTADVFVLPSFVEGLPISLLEAMALEVPCVSTRVNAIPEAVIHDETGCLIEAGDSGGLAQTIVRLKGDPELRKRLARAGRERVLRKFNEKEVAKVALERYLTIAAG